MGPLLTTFGMIHLKYLIVSSRQLIRVWVLVTISRRQSVILGKIL